MTPQHTKTTPRLYPKIFSSGGKVPQLKGDLSYTTQGWAGNALYGITSVYPSYVIDYKFNDFPIYVSDSKFFMPNLKYIVVDDFKAYKLGESVNKLWDLHRSYCQSMAGVYIATFRCGISLQNLTPSPDIPKQITSLFRFHVYFITRWIMYRCDRSNKDIADVLRLYLPDWWVLKNNLPLVDKNGPIKSFGNGFKRYCPRYSNGLTDLGGELLRKSTEVYIYSILGAQLRTEHSIVGPSSGGVTAAFRKNVEDAIIKYSPDYFTLAQTSLTETRLRCDLIVTPNSYKILRRMIMLDKSVKGFSDTLAKPSKYESFGYSSRLDRSVYKKVSASEESTEQVVPTSNRIAAYGVVTASKESGTIANQNELGESQSNESILLGVLIVSAIGVLVISKYM